MFAEEVENILKEREKIAETFFKEEVEVEEGKTRNDRIHDDGILPDTNVTEEEDSPMPKDLISRDVAMKQDVHKNEDSNLDEMTRALILEEDSSDNCETEHAIDNIFLPSKTATDFTLGINKCTLQNENIKIVNENRNEERPTSKEDTTSQSLTRNSNLKESVIHENSADVDDILSNCIIKKLPMANQENMDACTLKTNDSKVSSAVTIDKFQEESESLRLFLEPDDDQIESAVNLNTNTDSISIVDSGIVQTPPKIATEEYCEKSKSVLPSSFNKNLSKLAGRVDLSILEGTLANISPPKLGKKNMQCAKGDSDDFLIIDVKDNGNFTKKSNRGLNNLKERFVKHVKGNHNYTNSKDGETNKLFEMTIVSKDVDSEGKFRAITCINLAKMVW